MPIRAATHASGASTDRPSATGTDHAEDHDDVAPELQTRPPTGITLTRRRTSTKPPISRTTGGATSMASLHENEIVAQPVVLDRSRAATIQVGNLRNEHALKMRMAQLQLVREAMDDDKLRRVRYSSASMGDGVTDDKYFDLLTTLATFEADDHVELFLDELKVVKSLGYGAFSVVELVRVPVGHSLHARAANGLFAIKRISVPNMTPYGGNAPQLPAHEVSAFDGISIMAEGALMKNLNHPNILKCYGAIGRKAAAAVGGGLAVRRSALILDYAPGGTLRERIEAGDYSTRQAVSWLLGVARGICYLHDLHGVSVAHRDLKPSNILLGADGEMKIADLGLFRLMKIPGYISSSQGTSAADTDASNDSSPSSSPRSLGSRRASAPLEAPHELGSASPRGAGATDAEVRRKKLSFFLPRKKAAQEDTAATAALANLRMTGRTGTVVFMAPENWRAKAAYTQKVDIYSFAIIAWEVLSKVSAYDDLTVELETIGTIFVHYDLTVELKTIGTYFLMRLRRLIL